MPGLVAFGRRWAVGSDDLFLPSIILCVLHTIWFIITVIALIVDFEIVNKREPECASYVLEIIGSILFILFSSIFIELTLTIISLRGSILNDYPRKPAQYLIYIRLFFLISELIWAGFSICWMKNFYIGCDLIMTKQVMLGLVICTCFVILTLIITAWCTYDVAGRSWVKMKRYQANMKEMERKQPAYKRSGSRHRNWRQRKVIRAYQDSWNHRCRLMFCCIHSKRNRDSFADLARLLSEFFRDLDVVPSDVVVGLLLLRRLQRLEQCSIVKQRRNNTYEFLSGIAITPKTKFVALNDPKDLETFRNVVHYMQYASAAYGWPWYVIPNGVNGVLKLCSNIRCCCHQVPSCRGAGGHQSDLSEVVLEDNCCYCNYAVIPTMFASGTFDVIYATYHVDVGETPFFVVVDYEKQSVVVSIRGTLSLKDVITDLNAEGEPLPINPPREDWLAHKGMVQAAVYMKNKLFEEKILENAFKRNLERHTDTYRLVLVGHSLGAGTAAILAVLLKHEYPNLKCYSYSPPGGLFSMPVVEYSKEFITTVIVGKDVVPRIGLSQMESLRADLINAIKKSQKPKWQTIMSGMRCCCCLKPEFARPQRLSSAPSIQSEEFMRTRRSLRDVREVTIHPNESAISLTVHQPLFPPGRIMHIVRHHPKKDEIKYESVWRRVIKKGEPVFQALWTDNTDYGQVLISPGMIQDHMPDQVLHALQRVVNNHGPAKPQRTGLAASSTSPLMLSKESLDGEGGMGVSVVGGMEEVCVERLQPQQGTSGTCKGSPQKKGSVVGVVGAPLLETSFSGDEDPGSADTNKSSPECTLLNPSPLIIDADADIEGDGDLTPTNMGLGEILASLNLSWDYVTSLQERFMEKEKMMGHERKHSVGANSSSACSEEGSTFKEIFGPIKYEDWMAPLASPETLSEISSLSSRASFLIPKDQSPLLKIKGGRNGMGPGNSTSLHRKNGKANGMNGGATLGPNSNGTNGTHSRSLSCTYPEVGGDGEDRELATISSSVLQFISNGANGGDDSSGKYYIDIGDSHHQHHPIPPSDLHIEVTNGGVLPTGSSTPPEDHQHHLDDDPMTPVIGDINGSYVELVVGGDDLSKMQRGTATNGNGSSSGEGKRVSFNLRRKYASKDSGCSVSDISIPVTPSRYEPIYPVFSHQEEYGAPTYNSPHYTYTGHSPQDQSPTEIFPGSRSPGDSDGAGANKFSFPSSTAGGSTTGNNNGGGGNAGGSSAEQSPHAPSSVSAVVSSSASPQLGFISSSAATNSDPGSSGSASGSTTTFIQIADLEAHLAQFHAHQQHHQQHHHHMHQEPSSDNSSENHHH